MVAHTASVPNKDIPSLAAVFTCLPVLSVVDWQEQAGEFHGFTALPDAMCHPDSAISLFTKTHRNRLELYGYRDEQHEKYGALVAKQAEVETFLEDADRMRAQLKQSTVATSIRIRDEVTIASKLLAMSAANGTSPQGLAELQDALALKQAQSNNSAATTVRPSMYLRSSPIYSSSFLDLETCIGHWELHDTLTKLSAHFSIRVRFSLGVWVRVVWVSVNPKHHNLKAHQHCYL